MAENIEEIIKAHKDVERDVYLDIENSSPLPEEVIETMIPYFSKNAYGNPTITHKLGWMAYETIMAASEEIAGYIDSVSAEEINFTPSETEANNLALIGSVLANGKKGSKVIISEIEPLSINFSSAALEKQGFRVVKIPVDNNGFIDLESLADAVDEKTVLVSIMSVNHEIGTIEPINEAVEIVKEQNPKTLFHTDASDAYGKIPLSVKESEVDLMTLSSSKILGPRGVGVLYVKEGVRVKRLLEGQIGTQKLWPGVENTPLIMGFLKASKLSFKDFNDKMLKMSRLRDTLMNRILDEISETLLNGPRGDKRAPDNVNVSILHCEGEALTIELSLNGVYVSSGSACTRRILQPSHILTAIGRMFEAAHGSILMKVTRYHTMDDIEYVLKVMKLAVKRLRKISPMRGK
ncbi:cysteine desulfurase [Candidatus Bathyarchaeota archaeon]|nr:MAG: cysteine desulfurase [Candidatus Bathyarchaeota archaeon]